MKHLELEQFQALLAKEVSIKEREAFGDHIIDCATCGTQFKALKALKDACHKPAKPQAQILRYALGVAAVMAMALSPYLFQKNHYPAFPSASELTLGTEQPTQTIAFAVNQEVSKVNFRSAVTNWSQQQNVLELVNLQNKSQ